MRIKKSALTLALALAVVFGIMIGANAADTVKTITATLNYGITVKYNGEAQELKDANGNRVYPISYEGTTYLPVRAVANLLGVEVNWDGPTQTVWLGAGYVPPPQASDTSSNTTSPNYYDPIPAGTVITTSKLTLTSTGESIWEGKTLGSGYTLCYTSDGRRYAVSNKTHKATRILDTDIDLGDGGQSLADEGLIGTREDNGPGSFYG